MKRVYIIIILVIAASVLVFGAVKFSRTSRALPGQTLYIAKQVGEWLDVNMATVPTTAKQEKYLEFSDRRVREMAVLAGENRPEKDFLVASQVYQDNLTSAENTAEIIIFLDGAEINLAYKFELATRIQEQELASLLENASSQSSPALNSALSTARIENRLMFAYMVEKYQITDSDVRSYSQIVREHADIVRSVAAKNESKYANGQFQEIGTHLVLADDYLKAGLNLKAYDEVNAAKDILYSKF